MCDYSLEMYASRLARESEQYVTSRFPSGSIGLVRAGDCGTAICVRYGTRLKLANLSAELRTRLGDAADDAVTFVRLEHGAYRDGVRFGNGMEISLQVLGTGIDVSLERKSPAGPPRLPDVLLDCLLEPAE